MKSRSAECLAPVSALLFGALFHLTGCMQPRPPEPSPEPRPSAETAPSATASASSEPEPAAAPEPAAEEPKTTVLKLDAYGLPLSIEVPKDTPVSAAKTHKSGGAEVGGNFSEVKLNIYEADAKIKTIAAAKASRKQVGWCKKNPLVKEEKDYLVFNCDKDGLYFLMLQEHGGVTYACESWSYKPTVEALDAELAACRTLKPL